MPPAGPPTVAVDDPVFRRSGRTVHGAGWQDHGPAPDRDRISSGTCFATGGIIVHLPFCTRPVCLPVLARLGPAGKTTVPARVRKRTNAAPLTGTTISAAADLVTRYAARWPIEQAFADARTIPGAGQARTRRAVERTVPSALLTSTLIITWHARHGHHRAGITARRHAQPWYHTTTEPAFQDMLTQLRHVLITARISTGPGAHPTPQQTQAVLAAWHAAAA